MKRPKQHQHLSFFSFFSRKPKSDPRLDKAAAQEDRVPPKGRDEIAITLTPTEHGDRGVVREERGEGGIGLSSASSSHEQLLPYLECPLCLLSQPRCHFPQLSSCPHRSCSDCLHQYLRIEITESRVCIACPQCPEMLAPTDVRTILGEEALLERYEEYQLRRFLASDPDTRWCPAPDCSYAVIANGCAECPKLSCGREGCGTEFCYHCRQLWHPDQTCDQARRQRSHNASGNNDAATMFTFNEETGSEVEEIKACPRCGAYIMKTNDGSCNRMNCTVCACQFCWLCMKEITDVHYLSPSGCTFWGKKPWSRTRKVLWQVGMLLGAPVIISLIAGLAIPVIIVGIPIYMGRKVYSRCKKNNISGSKQYLTVASGVVMSVFVSPVIAAVTVGVGVPLMVTYVYGVVPMSLCRNGWCGAEKDQAEPGKIHLEDLANYLMFSYVVSDHWTGKPYPAVSEASVHEATTLPSTSRSHPDKESNKELDNQSASTVALAGSMFSETQDPSFWEGNNIEVQVEIEAHPRDGREQSLSSILSSQSLSVESLGCSREQLCGGELNRGATPETINIV
ncbi:E3 ubiquitin-protein ligase RNF19A-like isoform X3 [Acipenser ruthenus]|nr:E3 ubiquitin-protein ligase RNF19A-like isoform X3 [Acipenser ruthenus]XP_033873090.1 E3 ubiquitin-protein ligase RNF19A-like isoform X3 [Acipenser ruthenus]XP_033873091.1 E3 ubiquitin-protein ligase RNF19A-like isoform X3 [Acipenser ruthenus]XP_058881584.1 E3 ubiquitin-protein ligase RNF19A-like isoform X3 [Acipenser ruthenus]